jgi:hypothetical protein
VDLDQPKRERLRFEEFDHHTSQNGRTRVRVVLMLGEDRFTVESAGVETREGAGQPSALES